MFVGVFRAASHLDGRPITQKQPRICNDAEGATRACFGGPGESVALSQLLGQAEFEKLVSEYL